MKNKVFRRRHSKHLLSLRVFDQVSILSNGKRTGRLNWLSGLANMVKRCAPSLIAQDIIGVQPMTGPAGSVFSLKTRFHNPVEEFESYIEELVDVIKTEWVDVWVNPEVSRTLAKVENRFHGTDLGHISDEELTEMISDSNTTVAYIVTTYHDCAFDLDMRGIKLEWSEDDTYA